MFINSLQDKKWPWKTAAFHRLQKQIAVLNNLLICDMPVEKSFNLPWSDIFQSMPKQLIRNLDVGPVC